MEAKRNLSKKLIRLIEKGVRIVNPLSVDIGEEVETERICGEGVVLYPGTRIYGAKTLISRESKLGYEAPVTVIDCQIGPSVELKGGFFTTSVFLERVIMGSGAQVREACILEEESSAGHTVGLKHTILFPFVTLGSLINFCDCLMTGGTSRKNHSEVGSSYIHFNYTPNQDKATPSLIGDVPRGVMLNQPPIFLGGQGGIVGPLRIGFGTVISAGTVYRKDCPEGGKRINGSGRPYRETVFHAGLYRNIGGKVYNNIYYLANLLALRQWYIHARKPFFARQEMGTEMFTGALDKCEMVLRERLQRFRDFSEKMNLSVELGKRILGKRDQAICLSLQKDLAENWPSLEETFTRGSEATVDPKNRDAFVNTIHRTMTKEGADYTRVIQELKKDALTQGTAWLQNIVNHITREALSHLLSYRKTGGKRGSPD
ncbi:MAG: UDP-N-acetylglucosamine pyrophosphorylase [Deltaproteobacteria bacterium]|nr:UDP-N-acetylglucosamine pyrophosphorylase [Deltaproteobacteria bacterium]